MSDKKEFLIPKNVNPHFEVVPNVNLKDLKLIVPSILFDVPFVLFVPLGVPWKLGVVAITLLFPLALIINRPIRENIPSWKHLKWMLDFAGRQKKFYYKKRGYVHEIESVPEVEEQKKEIVSRRKGAVVRTRIGSHQSY
jgi:hypothetical protein